MAFILSLSVCIVFLLAGYPIVLSMMQTVFNQSLIDAVSAMSFMTHFSSITRGILDLRDIAFFLINSAAWLVATVLLINLKKAG